MSEMNKDGVETVTRAAPIVGWMSGEGLTTCLEWVRRKGGKAMEVSMMPDIPPAVRLALQVLLNHIESGWENCRTLVSLWLEGKYNGEVDKSS
jgi:hypothetical protein